MSVQIVTLIVAGGAVLAFLGAAWMKKRTLYMSANPEGSQPISQEDERKREQKQRARGASLVWMVWMVSCIGLYAIALLGPTLSKVSAALADPTGTPTATSTPTITLTPTITNTPRETSTPRATWTPVDNPKALGSPTGTAGSLLDTILTPNTSQIATQTPRVVTNTIVQVQTKIVNKNVLVPVTQIVIQTQLIPVTVIVPVTVVVTQTFTPTVTETGTASPSPAVTETPSPTFTPTETPTP